MCIDICIDMRAGCPLCLDMHVDVRITPACTNVCRRCARARAGMLVCMRVDLCGHCAGVYVEKCVETSFRHTYKHECVCADMCVRHEHAPPGVV